MRASFITQYNPKLLGEYARIPRLKDESPEAITEHMQRIKEQKQQALAVSKELFDVDVHVFVKKVPDEDDIKIIIETKYGYMGGSACGDRAIKELDAIMAKLHQYYGVTQEDIDNRTRRYKDLVCALCR